MFPLQGGSPSTKLYVDDVFSAYTYTGTSSTQIITNGINLGAPTTANTSVGQQAYTTPGTYLWTCPTGVTSISVVCVGGGGAGVTDDNYAAGGGGGGLRYRNNIVVTPSSIYTVIVGAGGITSLVAAGSGGTSSFNGPKTPKPLSTVSEINVFKIRHTSARVLR